MADAERSEERKCRWCGHSDGDDLMYLRKIGSHQCVIASVCRDRLASQLAEAREARKWWEGIANVNRENVDNLCAEKEGSEAEIAALREIGK